MINRLAPWQRNMIALARGITLAPSGQMKWIANVTALQAKQTHGTYYSLFPIEADSDYEAARSAAAATANMLYQNERASTGFVNKVGEHIFMVTVGIAQGNGITKGHTLEILIREYRGGQ